MNKKVKKTLKIVGNTLFAIFLLAAIAFAISNVNAKNKGDIPSLFNRGYLSVETDSMNGSKKDSYKEGALVIIDLSKKGSKDLKVGDIVLFKAKLYGMDSVQQITHRIKEVVLASDGKTVAGYRTWGDKTQEEDFEAFVNNEPVRFLLTPSNVLGVVTGHVESVGALVAKFQTPVGFFMVIVLPTILFLIVELIMFIQALLEYKQEARGETLVLDKEALRKQLLEELKAEGKLQEDDGPKEDK